ncbi:GNAT family N-acetyltransferase [Paenibacillus paeoniae]|uniref:GNAT family N-acetyltransferase n=1 Tax=Paenibacillus paeoniae TaxID=2292705 RepID=A0A371PFZ9_9BACL|nr:GNAT family N-acetyltransferase [Paenibacillus paeoniae]REK74889.1 GNAT family N-acetyltransferase [Paenibacillus paeoniae]
MTIITRLSEADDFPSLVELNNVLWNEENSPLPIHWDSPEEYGKFNPPGSEIVALCDGQLCGYVSLQQGKMDSNIHVITLAIGVDSQFRGAGAGRLLLDAAYDWGKQHGKRKLSLRVLATNTSAIAFYEKCGFHIQGRLIEEFFLNGQYVDDIFMYKRIES